MGVRLDMDLGQRSYFHVNLSVLLRVCMGVFAWLPGCLSFSLNHFQYTIFTHCALHRVVECFQRMNSKQLQDGLHFQHVDSIFPSR